MQQLPLAHQFVPTSVPLKFSRTHQRLRQGLATFLETVNPPATSSNRFYVPQRHRY